MYYLGDSLKIHPSNINLATMLLLPFKLNKNTTFHTLHFIKNENLFTPRMFVSNDIHLITIIKNLELIS